MSDKKLWLVSRNRERSFGPFTETQILELIDKLIILGEEHIAQYPGGEWLAISNHPIFYDRIVERLSSNTSVPTLEKRKQMLEKVSRSSGDSGNEKKSSDSQPADVNPTEQKALKPRGRVIIESSQPTSDSQRNSFASFGEKEKAVTKHTAAPNFKKKKSKALLIFLIIIVAALGFLILQPDDANKASSKIKLIQPRWPENVNVAPEKIRSQLTEIASTFAKDTPSDYLKTQNDLVRFIEQNGAVPEAISLLCLTQRELWPLTAKDTASITTISRVAQKASQQDPLGIHGSTCRVVQLILSGKTEAARTNIDSILNNNPQAVAFYEMKAALLEQKGDTLTAISYAQKTKQLWPAWKKAWVVEARSRAATGGHSEAAAILRSILKENPHHVAAKLELSQLELFAFNQADSAQQLASASLKEQQWLTQQQEARVNYILAVIQDRSGQGKKALELAKKAFSLDTSNQEIKNFLIRLGGTDFAKQYQAGDQELIATGEQFQKSGNCFAAQAEFKSAFELNHKNAVAAQKAGECLWEIRQGKEAIDWLLKAMQADPSQVHSYVLLSSYYAQRYEFTSAYSMLNSARSRFKENYEVERGFADLELQRKNYSAAIQNAKHALKLYDTDLEAHLILVKALLASAEKQEAFQYAARAIELDANNPKAQSVYAEALAQSQGASLAFNYLRNLMNTYPTVIDYRIAYGKVLKLDEKWSDAEKTFKQVTDLESENKDAFMLMGECQEKQSKWQDALKSYLSAATLDPSDAMPLSYIANVHLQTQKPQAAIDQYNRVLKLNENFPRTYYNLGRAYMMLGDYNQALQMAQKEQKINPNLADPYLLAADSYVEVKQYSKAIGEYQKAIKLRSAGAALYVKMGRAYRLSGSLDLAISMLNTASAKESGYAEIYKELGAVYEQKNSSGEAAEAYRQYLKLVPNASDRAKIQERIQNLGG